MRSIERCQNKKLKQGAKPSGTLYGVSIDGGTSFCGGGVSLCGGGSVSSWGGGGIFLCGGGGVSLCGGGGGLLLFWGIMNKAYVYV